MYKDIAESIRSQVKPDEPIFLAGEIGALAFYSERRLYDDGLSDRQRLYPWLEKQRQAGGWKWTLLQANFRHLQVSRRTRETKWHVSPPGGRPAEAYLVPIQSWEVHSKWRVQPGYIRLWRDTRT